LLAIATTLAGTARAESGNLPLDFVGNWHNLNNNTRDMTEINVDPVNGPIVVVNAHGFGRCHPSDCDWGTEDAFSGPSGAHQLKVTFPAKANDFWHSIFAYNDVTLTFVSSNRLNYQLVTRFVDHSGRQNTVRNGQLQRQ
jgi:hypothetical protein